jgi:excisionase family DNA binding protein
LDEPLLRAPHVAQLLDIQLDTVYAWVEAGKLPCIRFSDKAIRIPGFAVTWIVVVVAYLVIGFVLARYANTRPQLDPWETVAIMIVWPVVLVMLAVMALGPLGGGK